MVAAYNTYMMDIPQPRCIKHNQNDLKETFLCGILRGLS